MRCKLCTRKNILLVGIVVLIIIVSYISINTYYVVAENRILNDIEKNKLQIENIINSYYDSGRWDFSGSSKDEIRNSVSLVEKQLELYLEYKNFLYKNSIIIREKNMLSKRKLFLEEYDSNYEEYDRLLRFLKLELDYSIGSYNSNALYYEAEEPILVKIVGDDVIDQIFPEAKPVSILKDGEEIIL